MCLDLRKACNKPYNRSTIRYKVLCSRGNGTKTFTAPFLENTYTLGRWHRAKGKSEGVTRYGFHVLNDLSTARNFLRREGDGNTIVEVRVKGFLKSGTYGWLQYPCETWERMKIVKIVK